MATETRFAISGVTQSGYANTYPSLYDYVTNETANLVSLDVYHTVVLFGENNQTINEPATSDFSGFTTDATRNITVIPEDAYFDHDFQESNMILVTGSVAGSLIEVNGEHVSMEGFIIENTRNESTAQAIDDQDFTYLTRMVLKANVPLREFQNVDMTVTHTVIVPLDQDNSSYKGVFNGDNFNNNLVYYFLDMRNQGGANTVFNNYSPDWGNTNNGVYSNNGGLQNVPGTNAVIVADETLVFVAGSPYLAMATGDHRLWDEDTNPLKGAGVAGSNIGPDDAYYKVTHDSNADGVISAQSGLNATTSSKQMQYGNTSGVISVQHSISVTSTKDEHIHFLVSGEISEYQGINATAQKSDNKTITAHLSAPADIFASVVPREHVVLAGYITAPVLTEATTNTMQSVKVAGSISVSHYLSSFVSSAFTNDPLIDVSIYETGQLTANTYKDLIPALHESSDGIISVGAATYGSEYIDTDGYYDLGEAICLDALWNADIELDGEMNRCQRQCQN